MASRGIGVVRHFAQAGVERERLPLSADSLVPAQLLNDDEIVILAMKPSLWFIILVSWRWLAVGLPLAFFGWYYQADTVWTRFVHPALIGQVGLAAVLGRVSFGLIQWLARFYVLTDRRVLSVAGIFNIDVFECSLLKVQHTLMRLSLGERILGVGTIGFATAGTATIESVWRHIADPLEVQGQVQLAIEKARRRYGMNQV